MSQNFQNQHADNLARIASGAEVLVAQVTVDDEVLIVRAEDVGNALVALHGDPKPGLTVIVQIKFVLMTVEQFAAVPDHQ